MIDIYMYIYIYISLYVGKRAALGRFNILYYNVHVCNGASVHKTLIYIYMYTNKCIYIYM